MPSAAKAVSYTHLDVYKRQVITWLLVWAAIPLWVALWVDASTLKEISDWGIWDFLLPYYSPFARWAIVILSVTAAMIVTWGCMVRNLWVGLSGSRKYVRTSAALSGVAVMGLLVALPNTPSLWSVHWQAMLKGIAWALGAAVIVKLWLAVVFWDKTRRQHLSSRLVAQCLLAWVGGTACLVTLAWLMSSYVLWLKYLFVLGALLGVPLARLGLAPLALARNRHH